MTRISERQHEVHSSDPAGDVEAGEFNGAFSGLLEVSRHRGYAAGYHRAIRDVLSDLILLTEQHLRQHPDAPVELRELIYNFEEVLQRRYSHEPPVDHFEGGLGI